MSKTKISFSRKNGWFCERQTKIVRYLPILCLLKKQCALCCLYSVEYVVCLCIVIEYNLLRIIKYICEMNLNTMSISKVLKTQNNKSATIFILHELSIHELNIQFKLEEFKMKIEVGIIKNFLLLNVLIMRMRFLLFNRRTDWVAASTEMRHTRQKFVNKAKMRLLLDAFARWQWLRWRFK